MDLSEDSIGGKKMIKAVLFDLDGTLVDSLESIASASNKVLTELKLTPLPKENYKYYCGDGAADLVRRFLRDGGDKDGQLFDKAYERYQEIFREDCTYKVTVFDGIQELIVRLKEQGIKVAVVSNKPHARTLDVITKLFGTDTFDVVLGQREGVKKKPDPSGPLEVTRILKVLPSECAFVGDTNVDMQTGTNAGMLRIGVLWGFRTREELEENGADEIVQKPIQIVEKISQ